MSEGLAARGVKVAYRDAGGGEKTVLDIAALEIARGAATAIMGPSGCGKSTLLYALAGIARATGSVTFAGVDVLALPGPARAAWRRAHVGFVFQDFQLVAELSPLENVLLPARFDHARLPAEMAARARALLDRFGVPAARRSVADLSRGEAQRVALARALLRDPAIILADEPTASLDAASAAPVAAALAELAREGKAVAIVTHDSALAESCGRRVKLDHGRIADALWRAA